jgi:hypothetical protein
MRPGSDPAGLTPSKPPHPGTRALRRGRRGASSGVPAAMTGPALSTTWQHSEQMACVTCPPYGEPSVRSRSPGASASAAASTGLDGAGAFDPTSLHLPPGLAARYVACASPSAQQRRWRSARLDPRGQRDRGRRGGAGLSSALQYHASTFRRYKLDFPACSAWTYGRPRASRVAPRPEALGQVHAQILWAQVQPARHQA